MTDFNAPAEAGGDDTPIAVVEAPQGTPEKISSISEAARVLRNARKPAAQQQPAAPETGAEDTPPAAAQETDLSAEDNAAQAEEPATGETEGEPDPTATSPIEPPRSWSQDARERWSKLDPETQQYLLNRDREDSAAVRRAQNEAAEQRKAYEERVSAADQMRQQYEQALPILLQNLQQSQAGEFADVKTMADVEKLAREDWPRYILWDAQQKRIAAVHQELVTANQRQQIEQQQQWQSFAQREDQLFAERHPEVAEPAKAQKIKENAISTLKDTGFSDQELAEMWSGQKKADIRDHRWQSIMLKAAQFDAAKKTVQVAPKKAAPPVQRPGVAQPANAGVQQEINSLEKRFAKTGNPRDAAALTAARRAAASRR